MNKVIGLILSSILLLSGQAWAGENMDIRPLSPQSASRYSLYGTLIPGVLCAASLVMAGSEENSGEDNTEAIMFMTGFVGLWFGPGIGYLYTHHPWGFWRGALIRIGGTGAMITALAFTWDDPNATGGWAVFLGGVAIIVGSAIYDIGQAGKCAENYNRKMGYSKIGIGPLYFQEEKTVGLGVTIRF
ncbi:MAG TPA: hypothetical protein ENO22_06120 [candidate division Zixibacteria bacterium]|nr:hypothetical protein [candidate division Zixibacteria bacterium]